MSDGFLARWSRRKRDEARRVPEPPTAAPDSASPVAVPAEQEGSLSPEELARLPSLNALTAATDLAPFLRAGVPRALRNAALRRMWSLDPTIRDFVSEAREYAYDWNTPGGVPGTGGAISAEDVRAMVETVFGGGAETASAADAKEASAPADGAPFPSPRGRGEGSVDPVLDGASPKGEGKGGSPDDARPARPRSGCAGAPFAPDEEGKSLSQPAGRGEVPLVSRSPDSLPFAGDREPSRAPEFSSREGHSRLASDRADSPSPSRLRRHGGALPI
jgi:hypothetical protein